MDVDAPDQLMKLSHFSTLQVQGDRAWRLFRWTRFGS